MTLANTEVEDGRTVEPTVLSDVEVDDVRGPTFVVAVGSTDDDVVLDGLRKVVVVVVRRTTVVRTTGTVVIVVATTIVVLVVEVVVVVDVDVVAAASPPPPLLVAAAMVTVVDLGDPVSVVCAFPAESVIEKPAAAVNVDTVAPPPAVADDVTFTVHTVDDVCTIESIVEMFVNVKSVPTLVDNVEHVTASLPVTVKLIDTDVDVAAEAANVTVGAVVSRVIVVDAVAADTGPALPAASLAPLAANRGVTVPSPQPDTVTVRDDPESVPGANEQPDAVPVFVKSPAATPVTDSENVKVYVNDDTFVGVD